MKGKLILTAALLTLMGLGAASPAAGQTESPNHKTIIDLVREVQATLNDPVVGLEEIKAEVRDIEEALQAAVTIQAQASQGAAAPGNTERANLLVIVTDMSGAAVTGLQQAAFSVVNHFGLPGQTCGFSSQIVGFNDVGTGAYQLQIGLGPTVGCTWVAGDYLGQLRVNGSSALGQAAFTLSVS